VRQIPGFLRSIAENTASKIVSTLFSQRLHEARNSPQKLLRKEAMDIAVADDP